MFDTLCQFAPTDHPHEYRCGRCGLLVAAPHGPGRLFARCTVATDEVATGEAAETTWLAKAWNLAGAVAAFVADGLRTVDPPTYAARLKICDNCPERRGDTCTRCGCRLSLKARGRAFTCPLNKWPA